MQDLDDVVRGYCEAARRHAVFSFTDPVEANKSFRELQTHYEVLRQTRAGRDAITSLISHEDTSLRLWAAAHSLEWAPDVARAALEQMRDSGGPGSFDAKWILKQYEKKGRLSFGAPAVDASDVE